eukprot:6527981-Pyramimonas_sp.AAC.1
MRLPPLGPSVDFPREPRNDAQLSPHSCAPGGLSGVSPHADPTIPRPAGPTRIQRDLALTECWQTHDCRHVPAPPRGVQRGSAIRGSDQDLVWMGCCQARHRRLPRSCAPWRIQ